MNALVILGWVLGALTVWAFVWAAARKERIAAEEGDRRIEAADAEHREHMRQLRAREDELAYFGSAP